MGDGLENKQLLATCVPLCVIIVPLMPSHSASIRVNLAPVDLAFFMCERDATLTLIASTETVFIGADEKQTDSFLTSSAHSVREITSTSALDCTCG